MAVTAAQNRADDAHAAGALAARDQLKALFEAVHSGDVERFTTAAEAATGSLMGTAAVRDAVGRSVLHHAAQCGHLRLAEMIIKECGAELNGQDETGETALTLACGTGASGMVHLLLDAGADVNLRKDDVGPAAVHRAASTPCADALEALLEAGADPNMSSETGPPLCWAAGSGQAQCVERLLQRGADPNLMTPETVSALLMAAATGSVSIIKMLLAHGANPNQVCQDGATALLAAAAFPNAAVGLEMVDALLQAGADANLEDDGGTTPILAAGGEGHMEVVARLLPHSRPIEGVEWTAAGVAEYAGKKYGRCTDEGTAGPSGVPENSGDGPATIPEAEQPDEEAAQAAKRRGDEAFVRGDFQAADAAYSESLRHSTSSHLVWANRSAALLRLGRASAALQDARISRTLSPTYAKAWYREGSAHAAMASWEDAAHAFYTGCRADPNNMELVKAFHDAIAKGKAEHAAKVAATGKA